MATDDDDDDDDDDRECPLTRNASSGPTDAYRLDRLAGKLVITAALQGNDGYGYAQLPPPGLHYHSVLVPRPSCSNLQIMSSDK